MDFKYLLLKESWQKVLLNSELKVKFKGFMDMVYFYLDIAIPLKSHVRETNMKRWIAQGLKISSKQI
jgi:hypothetical protein